MVDENEYAERVKGRIEEGFIVDDDGEYVEDGREIFDEDEDEAAAAAAASYKGPKKKAKEQKKKRGNIKNMLMNMGAKKMDKSDKAESGIKDDDVLESLLGDMKSSKTSVKRKATTSAGAGNEAQKQCTRPSPSGAMNPFAKPKSTGIRKPKAAAVKKEPDDDSSSSALALLDEDEMTIEDVPEEDDVKQEEITATQNIEEFDEAEVSAIMDMEDDFEADEEEEKKADVINRGFHVKAETAADRARANLSEWSSNEFGNATSSSSSEGIVDVQVDAGDLPLTEGKDGKKVFRMYWLDAYEDPFKHPGTVWLFGKIYIESAKAHVSCCLTVRNIQRQIFLVKRDERFDVKKKVSTGDDVGMKDVYDEFNGRIADRYKIHEHKSKVTEKKYAFEHLDVPESAQFLEVQYSAKFPALPSDLQGETFSRVFGANQSSLENFLISRKIKGPGWIDVSGAAPCNPPTSWCKVEAICDDPFHVEVVMSNPPATPPLTVMALNMKTTINPKTMQNEIALVSCLVHDQLYLDRPAPKEAYRMHFCALTRPADEVWPFDFTKALAAKAKRGSKIDKMDSERALLGFLLAKIGKLDPDIILGHDITGFDIDVLLHRTIANKIPHWSRLGRLRRSQAPTFKGKMKEKEAMTGRLICDLKISAKELIRCKSYELASLAERLLGKSAEDKVDIGCDEMRKAYESSRALLNVTNISLQEASDTLQVL
jgi:DNA polymerase alpha subunit A